MKTYAILNDDGSLNVLRRIPKIANPRESTFVAWAAARGYKPVTEREQSHQYQVRKYRQTTKNIYGEWHDMELEEAKDYAASMLDDADALAAIAATTTLEELIKLGEQENE